MEKLLAILFLSREYAHRRHLSVTGVGSFAMHMTLGEFYNAIGEKADAIAEAYQGRHGMMGDIPYMAGPVGKTDPADVLEVQMDNVEGMRYAACQRDETAIQNLIDEALACYLSTIYKLRNLR
jgi:hypothetical protein